MTQDIDKAKVLKPFFTSALTGKTGLQKSQVPETRREVCSREDVLLLGGGGASWGTLKDSGHT